VTGTELLTAARDKLLESTENFWTDAELLRHLNFGIKDLWRAISDNQQDYFFTTATGITMAASTSTLSGLPTDVAKVLGIEPVTMESYPALKFFPRKYNAPDMQAQRALPAQDPTSTGPIFYAVTGAGAPIGAPTIYVAPIVSSAVPLRLMYTPTTPTIVAANANPVPGESDDALVAWIVAHALGREREDRKPDPDWLSKYANEKKNILTFLAPRQEDEPDYAEAIFELWTEG
jgi:hypothetical protein